MGAFHDGHLALMGAALADCDLVVVSLFVNPRQFGPDEDFVRYPRDDAADARQAAEIGVDLLFAPTTGEMYPPGFGTTVDPGPVGRILEGARRPGHFEGVATVVTRLFGIVAADVAYFGQKDHQQVAVVRRIAADLALTTEVRAVPTVRGLDGLALSSRNAYLTVTERALASGLGDGLAQAGEAYAGGERCPATLRGLVLARLADPGIEVEYVELREAEALGPFEPGRAAVLLGAIRIGRTRLIDNVVLSPSDVRILTPAGGAVRGRIV